MKKIILSLMICPFVSFGQFLPDTGSGVYAVPTPNKDTLFITNTNIGDIIYRTWEEDSCYTNKPILIYETYVDVVNRRVKYATKLKEN